eukprot:753500-Hanusia_phi.AAC.4
MGFSFPNWWPVVWMVCFQVNDGGARAGGGAGGRGGQRRSRFGSREGTRKAQFNENVVGCLSRYSSPVRMDSGWRDAFGDGGRILPRLSQGRTCCKTVRRGRRTLGRKWTVVLEGAVVMVQEEGAASSLISISISGMS